MAFGFASDLSPVDTEQKKCEFNIILCIDSSESINDETFEQEVNFTQMYFNKAKELSESDVHLAIILYASSTLVTLNFTNNATKINEAFEFSKKNRITGSTFTDTCLTKAKNLPKTNRRQNLLFVVTDGRDLRSGTTLKDTVYDVIHNHNFLIHAAEFGTNPNEANLMKLAYKRKNLLMENSYEEITAKLTDFINNADICNEFEYCKTFPYMEGVESLEHCRNKKKNEVCYITCEETYTQLNEKITCLGRDAWAPFNACEKPRCVANPPIRNADNPFCYKNREGDSCRIKCKKEYSISTAEPMTCILSVWRNLPTCVLKKCAINPPYVFNADTPSCSNAKINERCYVNCKEGYIKAGDYFECTDENKWEGNVQCFEDRCYNYIPRGQFFDTSDCENTKINGQCDVKCEENYAAINKPEEKATCVIRTRCRNGKECVHYIRWENLPKCSLNICQYPPHISNAITEHCSRVKVGNDCEFQCKNGYVNVGETASCLSINTWSIGDVEELCVEEICPTDELRSSDLHLSLENCENVIVNGTCEMECISGYRPEVTSSETPKCVLQKECANERCSYEKKWINIPKCIEKIPEICPDPALEKSKNLLHDGSCANRQNEQSCPIGCLEGYQERIERESKDAVCVFDQTCATIEGADINLCTFWENLPQCEKIPATCPDPALEISNHVIHDGSCSDKIEGQSCFVGCQKGYQERTERETKKTKCLLNETCSDAEGADINACTFWGNLPVCDQSMCLVEAGKQQHKNVSWEGCSDSANGQNCTLACKGDFVSLETINTTLCVIEDCSHGEKNCNVSAKWENVPECVAPLKPKKLEKVAPLVLMGGSALVAAASAIGLGFAPSLANTVVDFPMNELMQHDFNNDAAIQDTEILIL